MEKKVSKSHFKAHALHYFRLVEKTGTELVITDRERPVLKIVPFSEDPLEALKFLRKSVLEYHDPLEPAGLDDWEALK